MAIDSINSVNVNNTQRKNPVEQGALIGAFSAAAIHGANSCKDAYVFKKLTGKGYLKSLNQTINDAVKLEGGGKKMKAGIVALIAVSSAITTAGISTIGALIGAGIGKLVKNHNEKKEAEKQEIINQVKTELTKEEI